MFVPFLSTRQVSSRLARRRGGGGGGGKGGGGSSGAKGGSSGSSGKGTSSTSSTGKAGSIGGSSPISGLTSKSASPTSSGGGKVVVIPAGTKFAGRKQGGGTRGQIWGTRAYGSGYPGLTGNSVGNRPFPFYFWPLAWGTGAGYGSSTAYLHGDEYGHPDNTSRPGGAMMFATFQSNATTNTGGTFRLVADSTTVANLMPFIASNCSSYLVNTTSTPTTPTAFDNSGSGSAAPEEVVQYYRASSIALTLDGYNNSHVFAPNDTSVSDTPLPTNIDLTLLDCLNQTIGNSAPLIDGARASISAPSLGVVALVLVVRAVSL
ncbi:hypothetical protein C8R46DRAFT_1142055 [Mycena filopes]|nr:hypothetical protein C8R46DRAFT_1142055 [Mycena filopes]